MWAIQGHLALLLSFRISRDFFLNIFSFTKFVQIMALGPKGPHQGHNLNKLGRSPLGDAIQYINALGQ